MKIDENIKIDSLKTQIEILKHSIDSIKISQNIKELDFKVDQKLNIINDVNEFYDSAWLKLVFLITILGVLVPFLIQYFQRLSNKEIFDKYSRDFETKLEGLKSENENSFRDLTEKYNSEIKGIKEKYEKSNHRLIANTFFLQGRVRRSENNHKYALIDFIIAANNYSKINRSKDLDVALNFVELSIDKIENKSDFDEVLVDNKIDWNDFVKQFDGTVQQDRINSIIGKIEKMI